MSKKFIITEEERNNIKSLYNINEDIVQDVMTGVGEYIDKRMKQPGGPFANQTTNTSSSSPTKQHLIVHHCQQKQLRMMIFIKKLFLV